MPDAIQIGSKRQSLSQKVYNLHLKKMQHVGITNEKYVSYHVPVLFVC